MIRSFTIAFAIIAQAQASTALNNCKEVTAEQLNKEPKLCKSSLFDEVCIAAIKDGIANLGSKCIEKIPSSVLDKFPTKQMVELTSNKDHVATLPRTPEFLKAFLDKNDWKNNPATDFVNLIVADTNAITRLRKHKIPGKLMARLFTAENIKTIDPTFCGELDKDMAESMGSDALKDVQPKCFKRLTADFLSGVDKKLMKKINPEVFTSIKKPQMDAILGDALEGMTVEQANHLGAEPRPPKVDSSKGDKKAQKVDRENYIKEHQCSSAVRWKNHVSKSTAKALSSRCKALWDSSSGASVTLPHTSTMVAMAALLLVAVMA
ncbi:hypothetical protein PSACC_01639 [Paramicrosporidium saccamoebae]|uniref:Uncharacterized protein n=1 Tax=Paramicrosporidium saccamoebae TaxID=1246581 RepID=A0A2H9TLA7_9FUNG|nr:hypothetical protein PSACC_01639 [Paramicrosporidium saccamoebae]